MVSAILTLAGVVVSVVSVFFCGVGASAKDKTLLMFVILGLGITTIYATDLGEYFTYKRLVREVDLRQVTIAGQKDFSAQIQITYKDGKLESVKLVPKTTVEVGK